MRSNTLQGILLALVIVSAGLCVHFYLDLRAARIALQAKALEDAQSKAAMMLQQMVTQRAATQATAARELKRRFLDNVIVVTYRSTPSAPETRVTMGEPDQTPLECSAITLGSGADSKILTCVFLGHTAAGDEYQISRVHFEAQKSQAIPALTHVTYAGVEQTIFEDATLRAVMGPASPKP